MDNQHRAIKGYRELTQGEIDLMNEIKGMGVQLAALTSKVRDHIHQQRITVTTRIEGAEAQEEELARINAAEPEKWAGWGHDSGQTVLMYLTRAVAQPTFY